MTQLVPKKLLLLDCYGIIVCPKPELKLQPNVHVSQRVSDENKVLSDSRGELKVKGQVCVCYFVNLLTIWIYNFLWFSLISLKYLFLLPQEM